MKTKPLNDKKYRDWIDRKPCLVSGYHDETITHHHVLFGGGGKKDDRYMIPLRWHFHTGNEGLHTIGVKTWYDRYISLMELKREAEKLYQEYLEENR